MRPYKPANPLVWGLALGIFAGIVIFLSDMIGSHRPDNTLLATPERAAGAFFGFGVMVAIFRNWLNERRKGP